MPPSRRASPASDAAILEKRAELEQVLRAVAEPYVKGTTHGRNWKNLSLLQLIRILRQQGIIDEKTSALLDDLRTIGNQTAHSSDESEFTVAEALRFGQLTDEAISLVRAAE